MSKPIKLAALNRMAISNSKKLPHKIYFVVDGKKYYQQWVGIGWIDDKPNEEAVEIID